MIRNIALLTVITFNAHDRLIDFMKYSLSLEAKNSSATQEVLHSLRNPKVKFLSSQELATGPYSERDESTPHPSSLFLYDPF